MSALALRGTVAVFRGRRRARRWPVLRESLAVALSLACCETLAVALAGVSRDAGGRVELGVLRDARGRVELGELRDARGRVELGVLRDARGRVELASCETLAVLRIGSELRDAGVFRIT